MAINQGGSFGADNVYVIVLPPQPVLAPGTQSRNGQVVGGASWGPLNTPIACSTPGQLLTTFGNPIANNPAPMVTEGAVFLNQTPQGSLYCVRVDDGTSTAASQAITSNTTAKLTCAGSPVVGDVIKLDLWANGVKLTSAGSGELTVTAAASPTPTTIGSAIASAIVAATTAPWTTYLTVASATSTAGVVSVPVTQTNSNVQIVATLTLQMGSTLTVSNAASVLMTVTAKYNGTFGNNIELFIVAGSLSNTIKLINQIPNANPEVWDNIPAISGTVAAAVNAINNGTSPGHPASQYIVATAGADTVDQLVAGMNAPLVGGTDGVTNITKTALIGVNGGAGARTGMYAFTSVSGAVLWFAGCTDTTTWSTMDNFAKAEDVIAIGSLPQNTLPAAAITAVSSAGVSDPWFAIMMNHLVVFDPILNATLYIAPACILAGIICSINPWQSPGNKTVSGILGTDKTYGPNPITFAAADDSALESAGITYVSATIPGANAFGIRNGKNSANSSSFATGEIAYTTMTNNIVNALEGPTLGQFVNQTQSVQANDPTREAVRAALNGYFSPQVGVSIDNFSIQCDLNNNTPTTIMQGYLYANVLVEYLSVINKFVINLTAGQTVTVTPVSSQ